MNDIDLIAQRRGFLGLSAAGMAAGVGAMLPVAAAAAAQRPSTPFTKWLDTLNGSYRQVFDMPEVNDGMGLVWAWVFLYTGPQAYGVPEGDLTAVIVLRHNAIPLALQDSAWAKYKLGEVFRIQDPETKAPAVRNPFYYKPGAMPTPDGIQNLVNRGVKVVACDLAIHFYSGVVAEKMKLKHEDAKADWMNAVHPGIVHAPSGVVAVNGSVSQGCVYSYAGG